MGMNIDALTISQFARELGVTRRTVYRWIYGNRIFVYNRSNSERMLIPRWQLDDLRYVPPKEEDENTSNHG